MSDTGGSDKRCCYCDFMTDLQKREFLLKWIIQNVGPSVVPSDEGNYAGLIYNMVQLVTRSGKTYRYKPEQDLEVANLFAKFGVEYAPL